jgi:hypothetical protein
MIILPLHIHYICHYIPISTEKNLRSLKVRSGLPRLRGQLHVYIHVLEHYVTMVVDFSHMHLQHRESKFLLASFQCHIIPCNGGLETRNPLSHWILFRTSCLLRDIYIYIAPNLPATAFRYPKAEHKSISMKIAVLLLLFVACSLIHSGPLEIGKSLY